MLRGLALMSITFAASAGADDAKPADLFEPIYAVLQSPRCLHCHPAVNAPLQTAGSRLPRLWVIREELGLTGTKFGCGVAACGACTIHLDGEAVRSCVTPWSAAAGHEVTTVEGLDGLHRCQVEWIIGSVPQCGYCQPGQVMQ